MCCTITLGIVKVDSSVWKNFWMKRKNIYFLFARKR